MSNPSDTSKKETTPAEQDDSALREGLEALKEGRFDEAAEFFGELLQERVEKHGELAVECALPGYYYGLALLHVAQSSKEVFAKNEDVTGESSEPRDDGASDLAVAWETLECARLNFENSASPAPHSQLADVYVALGDVACETSNFESALTEYRKAISHLEQCTNTEGMPQDRSGGTQRRFCELYYKMCLAWEFLEDPKEASACCDKAINAIRLEKASLEDARADVAELTEIEKDLVERKEAIEISLHETEQVKDYLRHMLQQNLPEAQEKNEDVPVDLGIVGRGKQRIRVLEKTESAPSKTDDSPPTPRKRASGTNEDESASSNKKTKMDKNDENT